MRLVLVGLLINAIASTATAQDAMEIIAVRRLATHIMQVSADTLGTAVAIGSHLAVTNCHVIGAAQRVTVARGSLSSTAIAFAGDTGHDLCLLEIEQSPASTTDVRSSTALAAGEKVYAVGFTGGRLSIGVGKIVALYRHDGSVVVRTDAPFAAGASGGALFDSNQRLVGILTFYRHGTLTSTYWAMPTDWINPISSTSTSRVDRSHPPLWSSERVGSVRFLEVAGYEIDGDWSKMREAAASWLNEEPANEEAARALGFALERCKGEKQVTGPGEGPPM